MIITASVKAGGKESDPMRMGVWPMYYIVWQRRWKNAWKRTILLIETIWWFEKKEYRKYREKWGVFTSLWVSTPTPTQNGVLGVDQRHITFVNVLEEFSWILFLESLNLRNQRKEKKKREIKCDRSQVRQKTSATATSKRCEEDWTAARNME